MANLFRRVNFVPYPVVIDGKAYTGWISQKKSIARNSEDPHIQGIGHPHRVWARMVLEPLTGAVQLTAKSDENLRSVGGCMPADGGGTAFAMRIAVRGRIIIFTSTTECCARAFTDSEVAALGDEACVGADMHSCPGPYGRQPTDIASQCMIPGDAGGTTHQCLYWTFHEETPHPCGVFPPDANGEDLCTAGGGASGRTFLPGCLIAPDDTYWDIEGNDDPFHASNDRWGLMRYYVKDLRAGAHMVWPANYVEERGIRFGNCCAWLRHMVVHNEIGSLGAWRAQCFSVIKSPHGDADQAQPRAFLLEGELGKMTLVHFDFARTTNVCFRVEDQFCFTAGGGIGANDLWAHTSETNVAPLDHVRIDMNMRVSTDTEKYPTRSPALTNFLNDCLAELGEHVHELNNPGHRRNANFDHADINVWSHTQGWACEEVDGAWSPFNASVPIVRRRSGAPTGFPSCDNLWCVWVQPYDQACRHPYWVLLSRVSIRLWMSFKHASDVDNFTRYRALAQIEVHLDLQLFSARNSRIWFPGQGPTPEGFIPCPDTTKYPSPAPASCAPPIRSVDAPIVYTTPDGADYVPLRVHWRGLLGPRPWSKIESPTPRPSEQGPPLFGRGAGCGFFLDYLDGKLLDGNGGRIPGLVIPGEVNDFSQPDEAQRYEGDVVIML